MSCNTQQQDFYRRTQQCVLVQHTPSYAAILQANRRAPKLKSVAVSFRRPRRPCRMNRNGAN